MKKQVITYLLVGIAALPAASQEKLEGTLYVEGEYVPTVVRQDKIHLLPQKVSFELPTFRPEPATGLLTGNYVPGYNALPAPVWQGAAAEYPWRGYLYGGIGSYLNSTLSAGYRMVATDATKADIWFQHTGTSLFKPRICDRDLKRYRYDERLGLRVSHRFSAGTLTADAHYHLGFFNYYGVSTPHSSLIVMPPRMEAKQTDETPKQTLNDARLRASWQSVNNSSLQWRAGADVSYFGYQHYYTPDGPHLAWMQWDGQRELQVNAGAGLDAKLGSRSALTADVIFTNVSYNKCGAQDRSGSLQTVRIAPAYRYTADRFSARLGVVADITGGAGKALQTGLEKQDYSTFHIAPDVRLSYQGRGWNATLSATGGQQLQTLRNDVQEDYYQAPKMDYIMPAFVPVEGKLRIGYNGSERFRAGIDVTYLTVRHLYLGGWYMYSISGYQPVITTVVPQHGNVAGFSLGLDAQWQPFDMLTLRGRGTYQPQKGDGAGFFNGYDRPRWTADIAADVRPIKNLTLTPSYRYRGVRNIYQRFGPLQDMQATRLPDICNLSFSARYRISRAVSVFGEADNLLCRRVTLLPCQLMEGFNFLVGADVQF